MNYGNILISQSKRLSYLNCKRRIMLSDFEFWIFETYINIGPELKRGFV